MAFTKIVLVLVCLISTTLVAQEAKVAPLMSKDLTECPGKESVLITVESPPGHSDALPRTNASVFVSLRGCPPRHDAPPNGAAHTQRPHKTTHQKKYEKHGGRAPRPGGRKTAAQRRCVC